MATTRGRSTRRVPQRRKLVWARSNSGDVKQTLAASTSAQIQLLSTFEAAYGAGLIGCTIMRIRATITAIHSTANSDLKLYLGVLVSPDPVNTTISPITQPHEDWMYYDALLAQPPVNTESSVVNNYKVDVRARRRLDELGDNLYLCLHNVNTGGGSVFYMYQTSVLIALP